MMSDRHEDRQPADGSGDNPVSRRSTAMLLGVSMLAVLTGFAGTAIAYLMPRRGKAGAGAALSGRAGVLRVEDIDDGQGTVARGGSGKILVIRQGTDLIGLHATCTHLGCTVAWNGETGQVECPCHGARFDLRGQVLSGPAREPLQQVTLVATERGIELAS